MKHIFKTSKEPFARYFLDCESDNISLKTARGLYGAASEMPLKIDMKTGLPYAFMNEFYVFYSYGVGICADAGGLDAGAAAEPEFAEDYNYIKDEMMKHSSVNLIWNSLTENEKNLTRSMALWGGTWIGHSVPNFADIAIYGTEAFREKVEKCRKMNPGKDEFYDSAVVAIDTIDMLGGRFRDLADEMLKDASDPDEIRKLKRIVRTFSTAPQKPCTDFFGACAVYVMIFTFDGVDSPGHFDQYMLDFYRRTDEAERKEVLEAMWEFFHDYRVWNLCIGGSTADGRDLTNELTYDILDTAIKARYNTPNITLRVHKGTPDALYKKAAESLATGTGLPAIYNDEVVCPAYEAIGMPASDAHEYVMNGCNQIDIQGKSHMGLEDGEVNFGKAMEFTLSNGVNVETGAKLSISTGDAASFQSFDEVYDAFIKQLDFLTDTACAMSNKIQRVLAEHCPNPLRNLTIEGCLEKGIEYKAGGPLYGHGQILAEGMADSFDSLAAIKKFVFDEKLFDMAELCAAIDADFEGYPEIYKVLKDSPYRFGNDIEWVDQIASEVTDHFMLRLKSIKTARGGVYGGGCSPFNRAANNGVHTGALPNGKKRGEPLFADGIGAVPGYDTHGPTAALKSVMHYNQKEALSGFILNLKFDKSLFNTEKGMNGFISLARTYFANGGQQIQVNVLDTAVLLDAQKNPDKHKDLIVRVGGYSDYFNNLSKDLQDNVIARTGFRV